MFGVLVLKYEVIIFIFIFNYIIGIVTCSDCKCYTPWGQGPGLHLAIYKVNPVVMVFES